MYWAVEMQAKPDGDVLAHVAARQGVPTNVSRELAVAKRVLEKAFVGLHRIRGTSLFDAAGGMSSV